MSCLNFPVMILSLYVLTIWTIGHTRGCLDGQTELKGRCCNKCPPGTYMEEFCSKDNQTKCSTCKEGFYSDQLHTFDRCDECQSCHQEYSQKCTPTTNAACACHSGFLCSNNICSVCVENKCITGEKLKTIDIPKGRNLVEYSYECEPSCPENAYFDAKGDICKPRTQCSVLGLAEQFAGNITHNAECVRPEIQRDNRDSVQLLLGIGFVVSSVILLLILVHTFIKKRRRHRTYLNRTPVMATSNDFNLSKEESGLQFITQDESKDNNCSCQQQAGSVPAL